MKNLGLCQKACTGQSVYGHALNREILPLKAFLATFGVPFSFLWPLMRTRSERLAVRMAWTTRSKKSWAVRTARAIRSRNSSAVRMAQAIRSRIHQPFEWLKLSVWEIHQPFEWLEPSVQERNNEFFLAAIPTRQDFKTIRHSLFNNACRYVYVTQTVVTFLFFVYLRLILNKIISFSQLFPRKKNTTRGFSLKIHCGTYNYNFTFVREVYGFSQQVIHKFQITKSHRTDACALHKISSKLWLWSEILLSSLTRKIYSLTMQPHHLKLSAKTSKTRRKVGLNCLNWLRKVSRP